MEGRPDSGGLRVRPAKTKAVGLLEIALATVEGENRARGTREASLEDCSVHSDTMVPIAKPIRQ